MPGAEVIRVVGLADLQRELRKIDTSLPRQLRLANKEAAEVVAKAATSKAQGQGGVAAKSAPSIKAAGEQRRAKLTLGGPRFDFALGAEFGGQGRPTTQQFKPHLGHTGYFLYPAVRETRGEFIQAFEHAVDVIVRDAFPN